MTSKIKTHKYCTVPRLVLEQMIDAKSSYCVPSSILGTRTENNLITKITGQLIALHDDVLTLRIGAFEYEILIPEFARRRLAKRNQSGNQPAYDRVSRRQSDARPDDAAADRFFKRDRTRIFRAVLLRRRRGREKGPALDGPAGEGSCHGHRRTRHQIALRAARHRRGHVRADHRQAAPQGAEIRPDGRRATKNARPKSSPT